MSVRGKTASWWWCLALAGAFSCSVFPDSATLPLAADAATAGSAALPTGGAADGGGSEADPTLAGAGVGDGGGTAVAGTAGRGGGAAGTGAGAQGGVPPVGLGGQGAGGMGGSGSDECANPQQQVVLVTADTWIDAVRQSATHGDDATLSVVGGGEERRTLLQVTVPAVLPGATLRKATLLLHLQANADVTLARRVLRLHQLEQAVEEKRANWTNFSNGSKGRWTALGGDFGQVVAQSPLPAGSATGPLGFNVTAVVRATFAAAPATLPLILIENTAPPAGPADLAFTSREGDASGVPALVIDYCQP